MWYRTYIENRKYFTMKLFGQVTTKNEHFMGEKWDHSSVEIPGHQCLALVFDQSPDSVERCMFGPGSRTHAPCHVPMQFSKCSSLFG